MKAPGSPLQLYSLIGAVVLVIAVIALVIVEDATGHSLNAPPFPSLLSTAGALIVILLGFAGLGSAVQDVHLSVNSRLDQLVSATSTAAFQAGQAAGPDVPVPPATTPVPAPVTPPVTQPAP